MKKNLGIVLAILGFVLALSGIIGVYKTPSSAGIGGVLPIFFMYIPGVIIGAVGLVLLGWLPLRFSSRNELAGTLSGWFGYVGCACMLVFLESILTTDSSISFITLNIIIFLIAGIFMIAGSGLAQGKDYIKILYITSALTIILSIINITLKEIDFVPYGTNVYSSSATFLQVLAISGSQLLILSFFSVMLLVILFFPKKQTT
ncbi:MAG TPA: hypothetical protein VJI97_04195 [Candidatus Nanoarchaeia archaeon]|nr:hypothetical protein [Candidatus Nanoarchaeia archaeon]